MPRSVAPDLLTSLLRDVSRSFHRPLAILPKPVRTPIALAYLLARAADTIADTGGVRVDARLAALEAFRLRILGQREGRLDFSELSAAQDTTASPAERVLLGRVEEAIAVLESLSTDDRDRVRAVLTTITGGQELDLKRFGEVAPGEVRALATAQELEDYTYRVAGCVGAFWTRMCRAHLFPSVQFDQRQMESDGIRYGQGLQLVNILRDLPRDLRSGRCYLPADGLARLGLKPADLIAPGNEARLEPLYNEWLARAESHLAAGWTYTKRLPRTQLRLRLGCAFPVLLGVMTIQKLKAGGVLDSSRRIKVSRSEVRALLWATVWRLPLGGAWDGLDGWARSRP